MKNKKNKKFMLLEYYYKVVSEKEKMHKEIWKRKKDHFFKFWKEEEKWFKERWEKKKKIYGKEEWEKRYWWNVNDMKKEKKNRFLKMKRRSDELWNEWKRDNYINWIESGGQPLPKAWIKVDDNLNWKKTRVMFKSKEEKKEVLEKWSLFYLKIRLFNYLLNKPNLFLGDRSKSVFDLKNILFGDMPMPKKVQVYSVYETYYPAMHKFMFFEFLIDRYFALKSFKPKPYPYMSRIPYSTVDSAFEVFYEDIMDKLVNSKTKEEKWFLFEKIVLLKTANERVRKKRLDFFWEKAMEIGGDWKRKKELMNIAYYFFLGRLMYKELYNKAKSLYEEKFTRSSLEKELMKNAKRFDYYGRLGTFSTKCSRTNVFFTIADAKGNVFFTCTPGQVTENNNKRVKLASHFTEKIVNLRLLPCAKKYRLKRFRVVVKGRVPKHLKSIKYFFRKNKIFFNDYIWDRKVPHSKGMRLRKKRRL